MKFVAETKTAKIALDAIKEARKGFFRDRREAAIKHVIDTGAYCSELENLHRKVDLECLQ